MGFFANLFGDSSQRELELSRQEAFLGLMLCAAACDGVVSEAERQAIFTITERMKLFENISPHRWSHLTNQLIDLLQRDGQARFMMNCAESLPESLRDCVFANACDIIWPIAWSNQKRSAFSMRCNMNCNLIREQRGQSSM
jgi:hypothetical protein